MAEYRVADGDTFEAIAEGVGMEYLALYLHPRNEEFRARRAAPQLLETGDRLWLPDQAASPARALRVSASRDESDENPDARIDPVAIHNSDGFIEYKVRTGDSLSGLARRHGCTWQDIAILNWETEEPDEINWYLEHDFVCSVKQGANYIFDDSDEPGILLLPYRGSLAKSIPAVTLRATRFPKG